MSQRATTATSSLVYLVDFLIFAPLIFGFSFGLLILRAKTAFGVLPYLSNNSPGALISRAPKDELSLWFSYGAHINLVYLLLPFTVLSVFLFPFLALQFKRQQLQPNAKFHYLIMGLVLTAFLFCFRNGQLLLWLVN